MVGLDVYTYFMTKYRFPTLLQIWPDGVYRVNNEVEKLVGAHAALLHGWGRTWVCICPKGGQKCKKEEKKCGRDGIYYYEGRNSWGTGWGKVGLFRIPMQNNKMLREVMFASADPKVAISHSECIDIVQDGETKSCTFTNKCEKTVLTFKYSYLGQVENCGRWTANVAALFPGQQHTRSNALFCQVVTESTNDKFSPFDSRSYFADITHQYKSFPCVLKNTWPGISNSSSLQRFLCCGGSCVTAVLNQPTAFDEVFCSDEKCAASGVGSRRFEKVADMQEKQMPVVTPKAP
jgi:hypothetical protein